MKMLTPFITLFGLILFGCEQDNSENNNENDTEITAVSYTHLTLPTTPYV